MAWNFRRRIKLLPGVHLNLSKKGVSTTFGVRGASITTGKNGTYLNTSIPGTGIYKRQKIGSNNSNNTIPYNNQLNVNNNVSNSGCFLGGILFFSWILLISAALLIFSQSVLWGFIFTAFVVIVKIMTSQKKPLNAENTEIVEYNDNQSTSTNTDLQNRNIITNDYFSNITFEVENLISFYSQLCKDKLFLKYFDDNSNLKLVLNGKDTNVNEQLKLLICIDLTKCFVDLGHKLDLKSKEGFGLFYFCVRTNGLDKFDYNNLQSLNADIYKSANDFVTQINDSISINQAIDEVFLLSKLLSEYNLDLKKKYLVLLYRFASLTAKADNTINENEANWLSEILSLSENPKRNGNVIVSDNEFEDTNQTPQTKQTKPISKPKPTKLKSLIGLTSVKEEIDTLTNFIKIQQARETNGLKTSSVSYHCVFTGNPGTGKTTVARIVADIYKNLGILSKGHLVETDRSGLVAEYVGQTAVKTNKIIDSALDGILFIDEAYSLISNSENDYGKEAISTLLKRMEDDRSRLVVILAGYTNEMKTFIDSNPGLQSRFNRYIEFPDYTPEELYQIFELSLKQFDYKLSDNAVEPLKEHLAKVVIRKDKNFGNARFVRNLFEKTIEKQANRLSREVNLNSEKLSEICPTDIPM